MRRLHPAHRLRAAAAPLVRSASWAAEEELGPAAALGEPERTRMARVYIPLDRDKLPGSVTRLCPRGSLAWNPTGVRRGTLYGQGWNGLKARTYGEPGRYGPRAKDVSLGAIPITGVIGTTASFRSRIGPYLRQVVQRANQNCPGFSSESIFTGHLYLEKYSISRLNDYCK
jgi:hypothetical protein